MNSEKTDSRKQDKLAKRMLRGISDFAGREQLWEKGDRIMVAVSGGGDSVALLHLLNKVSPLVGFQLTVIHLDHCLRGAASRKDSAWVRELAERLDIPCITGKRDLINGGKAGGLSPEESARSVRYKFFGEVGEETGITTIALGHQADDQAETVLLKLLRGCGPGGLGAMRPSRMEGSLRIIRPLLPFRRSELREYLNSIGEGFREDITNQDTRFLRNRVRLKLLPLLEKEYNPGIREVLIHLAEMVRERDNYLKNHLRELYPSVVSETEQGLEIDCQRFPRLSGFEQGEILRDLLLKSGIDNPNRRHFQSLQRSIAGPSGRSLDLPGEIIARRENDILRITNGQSSRRMTGIKSHPVPVPGETIINEIRARLTIRQYPRQHLKNLKNSVKLKKYWESYPETGELKEYLDRERVILPLTVRGRRPGDRYRPLSMKGSRKIKEIFIDAKVPVSFRDRIPVIQDADGVIWLAGYRPAHRCRVRKDTRTILEITLDPI